MKKKKEKKIGLDYRFFGSSFTGIGRYNFELLKRFSKLNEESREPMKFEVFLNRYQYETHASSIAENDHFKPVLIDFPHYSWQEQTYFAKFLYQRELDLVHFPHFNLPLFYRGPFVVTLHDTILSFFPGKNNAGFLQMMAKRVAYGLVIRNAVWSARKVIAVSEHTKKDLINLFRARAEKIKVIYNGVGQEFEQLAPKIFQPTLTKYGIAKNEDFLLYTGVWRGHKNLLRLIEAFSQVVKKYSKPLKLVITGKKDPAFEEVPRLVKLSGLSKKVVFTGLIEEDELVHFYNGASLYVFPSLYEGFGLPPLEAMKCGTPVVASQSSAIPEVCGADNALFFDPYSVQEMTEKILEGLQNEGLRERLVTRGARRVANFSWDRTAKDTFQVITGCV